MEFRESSSNELRNGFQQHRSLDRLEQLVINSLLHFVQHSLIDIRTRLVLAIRISPLDGADHGVEIHSSHSKDAYS